MKKTKYLPVSKAAAASARHERIIVFALCMLAAIRVFIFCAMFPFFNNVDEQAHYDLVRKYARGHIPTGIEHFDVGAARDILLYGSPEYLVPAEHFPNGSLPPPVWTLPFDQIREAFESRVTDVAMDLNHESTQPPLYYAVAGLWYNLGEVFGLHGGQALYWIRFMNVIVCAMLVLLAYLFARTLLPDSRFLRLGMPFIVAFFPQDVLYSVNNDVLLPLVGGAALWALLVVVRNRPGYAFHAFAGLLVAATVLVKQSSLPVAFVGMVAVVIILLRAEAGKRSEVIRRCAVLFLAAGVPLAVYGLCNLINMGDVTGSATKTKLLGWSVKPYGTIFSHPLFSVYGLVTFWHETMTSFWRGEFCWGLKRIASRGWDLWFSISSFILPAAAIVPLLIRKKMITRENRTVLWLSLTMFVLSVLFLAAVSIVFDFHDCFYPSRVHPFMTSGRLALAGLLPFVALYLTGLENLLFGQRLAPLRWPLLIALVAWMTFSEIALSHGALHSTYNWFNLIRARG